MAKKLKAIVKLQLQAGKANPAPPVGTALGPHGVNIMGFVKEYNARTAALTGQVIPVEITIFTGSRCVCTNSASGYSRWMCCRCHRCCGDLSAQRTPGFFHCNTCRKRRCHFRAERMSDSITKRS